MGGFILRRLLQAMLVLVVVSFLVFAGVYLVGDPVDVLISPEATAIERLRVTRELGLDQPLWVQYLRFAGHALQGQFGNSFLAGQPAMALIIQRMPATLELAAVATLLAVAVGVPVGLYAGLKPETATAKFAMTLSVLGFSLPTFWVGLMLIMGLSVMTGWLPSSGRGELVYLGPVGLSVLTVDGLKHLALPALTLGLGAASLLARLTRATAREVVPMDFVKFARAKGLSERRVISVHVLKNLMIPLVTILGLEFGRMAAFAVITESIFAWPGMGKLLIDSVLTLDRPVVVAYVLIVVSFLITLNLLVDVTYGLLDPRIRLGDSR
ncbi:ABC transporter permease [Variovorax sp. J22P271]|uniref:ABC transporter permease n=1 Tax=Variovorax davisae TaxID=3053515 RepID=UPI0025782586|nr:ABC transporter permease [Variovorax sp. J22P271]MDM0033790.1 ABC transporter permease [Variovorax sp. J22P271]